MNQKAENLRERLLDVSMKQFVKKGYTGSTTMEIARLAGVSKGALYWHFKNKEDILSAILDIYCAKFIAEFIKRIDDCGGDFRTKFSVFYRFTTEFARANKELLLVFSAMLTEFADTNSDMERRLKDINEQYILFIQRLIEDGIEEGTVSEEANPVLYARFVTSTLMGSHLQWHLHRDDNSFNKQLAILQRDILLEVIAPRNMHRSGEQVVAAARSDSEQKTMTSCRPTIEDAVCSLSSISENAVVTDRSKGRRRLHFSMVGHTGRSGCLIARAKWKEEK